MCNQPHSLSVCSLIAAAWLPAMKANGQRLGDTERQTLDVICSNSAPLQTALGRQPLWVSCLEDSVKTPRFFASDEDR